jgi:nucleoside-diphosphate-sugar epimerase
MNRPGRRIALVGGAGFLGHHLAIQLATDGAQVYVIDHLAPYDASRNVLSRYGISVFEERRQLFHKHGVTLHRLDASERRLLHSLFRQIEPEIVFHLAAVASSEQTDLHPALALRSGLETLSNSLEYSKHHVQRFIYFSSSMVYGDFLSAEADENHTTAPVNLYGAIKLAGERLVVTCGEKSQLPWTILRPSAVYGPRCLKGSVIEKLLTQAVSGRALTITGDATSRLDFTYIDDVVNGARLALQSSKAVGEVFNLTFGCARTIAEVAAVICNHFPLITIESSMVQSTKPRRGTLRIDKARQLLGYCPEYSLEKGISKYILWMQSIIGQRQLTQSARAFVSAVR